MSTLVRASVPTDEFVLSETFERLPTVEFDALGLVTDSTEGTIPLLRARRAEASRVRSALRADSATTAVELVSRRDRDSLFRVGWTPGKWSVVDRLAGESGAVVSARGTSDGWRFRVLFPDREEVSVAYGSCAEYGVSIDRIRSLDEPPASDGLRLTETQYTTLKTAFENGYYSVPRGLTLEELAAELGVSHQALSERLRRGHRTLVESVLDL